MGSPQFSSWTQATHHATGAQPGAKALMAALLLKFPHAVNWGIFSNRDTALGNLSAHAEGRALDVGCGSDLGEQIVHFLLNLPPHAVGISVIIHNRRIYSRRSPHGRPYDGNPHTDHVHIEMTPGKARSLTLTRAKRIIGA